MVLRLYSCFILTITERGGGESMTSNDFEKIQDEQRKIMEYPTEYFDEWYYGSDTIENILSSIYKGVKIG